ncbi:MAG: DNA polymerase III, subunit gamma and tau [Flavobacteriaceae bacterium]|nr:DNA polymerase III, subunit gamma and tau [Flavobacteriaceae bacterium]
METYVVSALKYRPQSFEEVVGQNSITQTLENAIDKNQLAQALLFSGPRGVGKTSCARILAKKINSQGQINTHEDFAFNIFELDAASNNSVDDIRSLNEKVRIPPQVGTHKIYIIDEVHMLSIGAFNAFLKTLEEPPKHVIFILATTEKQKIIPTILSRCQTYDFKRISIMDCKKHLQKIANDQDILFEEEALNLIAQKSDGAMRDALFIYDRMISFTNRNLTIKSVSENLNILDRETFFSITNLILQNNIPDLLLTFDDLLKKGFDELDFIIGLGSHFRDLTISKDNKTLHLLEVSETTKEKYIKQTLEAPLPLLLKGIDLTSKCELDYRNTKNKRLLIELCLMQMASLLLEEK